MAQAAAMLGDHAQTWATPAYLAPFMQTVQDTLIEDVLKIPDIGQLTGVVVLSDVAIGTTDLSAHMAAAGILERLSSVISMRERATSTRTEADWQWMYPVMDMPTFNQGAFNSVYRWDGANIVLPGANRLLDLRVFGKFQPAVLVDGTSMVLNAISPILAFGTASLAALVRGNERLSMVLQARAASVQDSYLANVIMELQAVRARMRSYSGRGNV